MDRLILYYSMLWYRCIIVPKFIINNLRFDNNNTSISYTLCIIKYRPLNHWFDDQNSIYYTNFRSSNQWLIVYFDNLLTDFIEKIIIDNIMISDWLNI